MQPEACPLTRQEKIAVQMISDGKAIKAICHEMALSNWTVRHHLRQAKGKAKATGLPNLTAIAVSNGWVLPPKTTPISGN